MIRSFVDLAVGKIFSSESRTVTDDDITEFARLSGDVNPLHTDDAWVRENTEFEGRIAHGLLVLAISSGLRTPELVELMVLAYLNAERSMLAPTYPGDSLTMTQTVASLRPSASRVGCGVATFDVVVSKANGVVVQRGTDTLLIGSGSAENPTRIER